MSKKNANPTKQVCSQHMKPESEGGLGKSRQASTFALDRFSTLKSTGKKRKICKVCQTRLSLEWTRRRADYRKVYQQARMLLERGIAVRIPNAKDYQKGDVVRYENGKPFNPNAKTQPQVAKASAATA